MIQCDYCGMTTKKQLVATVKSLENKKLNIVVEAKQIKQENLRDNQFLFYLRRKKEFKFCSCECLSEYMGYFTKKIV